MCSISEYLFSYEGFFWILFIICAVQSIYISGLSSRILVMQNVFHELKKQFIANSGEQDD
jgi:hypothetical protein